MPKRSVVKYLLAGIILPIISVSSFSARAECASRQGMYPLPEGELKVFCGVGAAGCSRESRGVSRSLARVTAKNPNSVPAADSLDGPGGSEIFREYLAVGADDGNGWIYGRVIDDQTGSPVVMAMVEIPEAGSVAITDSRGFFRIERPGKRESGLIRVRHVSYLSVFEKISYPHGLLVIPAAKKLHRIAQIRVSARERKKVIDRISFDKLEVDPALLAVSAQSQVDPLQGLKENPAVSSSSDFDGRFSIHGSSPDANAFFLDGLLFPSPYHLGGLCSIYDPSNIKSFSFARAPYSASSFGGTGAVVEVETRDGSSDGSGNVFSLGVLSSAISSRNSINNLYGSFLARRSYIDLIYNSLGDEGGMKIPNFHDLQGNVVKPLGDRYYMKLGLVISGDNSRMRTGDLLPGQDEAPVLNWQRGMNALYLVYGQRDGGKGWVPKATLGWQPYSFDFDISGSDDERMHFSGGRTSFRLDMERRYSSGRVNAGIYASSSELDYDLRFGRGFWLASRNENSAVRAQADGWEFNDRGRKGWEYAAGYGEATWAGSSAAIRTGLRLEYFSENGFILSPSFTVLTSVSESSTLQFSGGVFARDTRDDFGNPASVAEGAGIEKGAEGSAGLRVEFNSNLSMELTGFLRKDWDLLVESEPVSFENCGAGEAYGFDTGIEAAAGGWKGTVKYAYTRARRRDGAYTLSFRPDRREEGAGFLEAVLVPSYWYRSPYEREHSLLLEGRKALTGNLDIIMKWSYNSGKPYTPIGAVEEVIPGYYVPAEGRKMSATLPPYSRLDLRLEWNYSRAVIFAEVMNVTNNSNYFNLQYNGDYTRRRYYRMLSVVPAFGVNIYF